MKNKRRINAVYYNGLKLDSRYELLFLLSIEKDHCYIHHPFKTWKIVATNGAKVINASTQSYTPDFLIRDLNGSDPVVVEVKGYSYMEYEKRKNLIDNFIHDNSHGRNYSFLWQNMRHASVMLDVKDKYEQILRNQDKEKNLYLQVKDWIKVGIPMINPFEVDDDVYERYVRNLCDTL